MMATDYDSSERHKRNQETNLQAHNAVKEAQALAGRLDLLLDTLEELVTPDNEGVPGVS